MWTQSQWKPYISHVGLKPKRKAGDGGRPTRRFNIHILLIRVATRLSGGSSNHYSGRPGSWSVPRWSFKSLGDARPRLAKVFINRHPLDFHFRRHSPRVRKFFVLPCQEPGKVVIILIHTWISFCIRLIGNVLCRGIWREKRKEKMRDVNYHLWPINILSQEEEKIFPEV